MVECVRAGIPVSEYAPTVVKRAVVGTGRADKMQVNAMIRVLLGLTEIPSLDASDALAVAICHSGATQFSAILQGANPTKSSAESTLLKLWKPIRTRSSRRS